MTKKMLIERLLNDPAPLTSKVVLVHSSDPYVYEDITEVVLVHHAQQSEDGCYYRALGDAGETVVAVR